MKKILLIIMAASSIGTLLAKPDVTWDDPNPVGANIVAYLVYEKVTTGGTTTWKSIWKVVGTKSFSLPATNVTKTYSVSALNNLGVEGPKSNELVIEAPIALQNLRVK
jgi:hypothetical protein